MAFYSDVAKGEKFQPSSLLSNDIRHMINSLHGFRSGAVAAGASGVTRIQVYNADRSILPGGSAVSFPKDGTFAGATIPAVKYKNGDGIWGVLPGPLDVKGAGDCVIAGPTAVSVIGDGLFAMPSEKTTAFILGDAGVPVIFRSQDKAIILLDGRSTNGYDGPFAVTRNADSTLSVTGGGLLRNGEYLDVDGVKSLAPEEGILCVCSTIEGKTWTKPEFRFTCPAPDAYPVADIRKNADSSEWQIRQRYVNVAVIMVVKICPFAKGV